MVNVATGPVLEEIGQIIGEIVGGDPQGSYLYVEAEESFLAPSLFHDNGERVVCYRPTMELCDAIERLWEMESSEKRWLAMHYEIEDSRFNARFEFPDQLDLDDPEDERLERALATRYGDKPIIYPEPDGNFRTLTLDDFPDE